MLLLIGKPASADELATTVPAEVDTVQPLFEVRQDDPLASPTLSEAHELIIKGDWDSARALLVDAIRKNYDLYSLHEKLSELCWYFYKDRGGRADDLKCAGLEAATAAQLAIEAGALNYRLTDMLARTAPAGEELKTLEPLFAYLIATDDSHIPLFDYARILARFGDQRAEGILKQALAKQPEDASLTGSLLEQWLASGTAVEPPGPNLLEVAPSAVTDAQAKQGVAYMIYGEARGESVGGQRAEGWVARSRVLRGNVDGCPSATNSGSTLAEKYKSVLCASSQFVGMCSAWCTNQTTTACTSTTAINTVAGAVFDGFSPDPVSGHCPGGIVNPSGTDSCLSTRTCRGEKNTYKLNGPLFNLAKASGIACSTHPLCVVTNNGKVCGNGGAENCFYSKVFYTSTGPANYTCTISTSGGCCSTAGFVVTSTSGLHRGHLEGPETTANEDFDLFLQKQSGTTWNNVGSSVRRSTVEDVEYTGTSGTYRWRVCSISGTGFWRLYTRKPS